MSSEQSFHAFRKGEGENAELYVHGVATVYTRDTRLHLTRADPQGTVAEVLLLDLSVEEGNEPRKGQNRAVSYSETGARVSEYRQVQIRLPEGEGLTVDIDEAISGSFAGRELRVYASDEPYTSDYREDRINVEIHNRTDNRIVRVWYG